MVSFPQILVYFLRLSFCFPIYSFWTRKQPCISTGLENAFESCTILVLLAW